MLGYVLAIVVFGLAIGGFTITIQEFIMRAEGTPASCRRNCPAKVPSPEPCTARIRNVPAARYIIDIAVIRVAFALARLISGLHLGAAARFPIMVLKELRAEPSTSAFAGKKSQLSASRSYGLRSSRVSEAGMFFARHVCTPAAMSSSTEGAWRAHAGPLPCRAAFTDCGYGQPGNYVPAMNRPAAVLSLTAGSHMFHHYRPPARSRCGSCLAP